jgi:hypothetical protein
VYTYNSNTQEAEAGGTTVASQPGVQRETLSQKEESRVPVAPAYNPSYSGGRDQEDNSSKIAPVNSCRDPISKKPITKKGLVEWLKV